jgi:hypothetical protein
MPVAMAPKVEFDVSKAVNEFCHLSVIYSDLMPTELAKGILGNRSYQEQYHNLRRDDLRLAIQKTRPFSSESEWYKFVTGLMRRDGSGGFQSLSGNSEFVKLFQNLRQRRATDFDEIWKETRPRLTEYMYNFESLWSPISDRVLSKLQHLAKTHWQTGKIHVHFIDCLYGGFGWNDCIGFAAFPDMEVQKKFIAHELSELLTPQHIVAVELQKVGLNPGITHTVVDMLAYFSVRDFIAKPVFPNPEKKGIRPNRNYYPNAEVLLPVFEHYAEDPSVYPDFASFVQEMIQVLTPQSVSSTATN